MHDHVCVCVCVCVRACLCIVCEKRRLFGPIKMLKLSLTLTLYVCVRERVCAYKSYIVGVKTCTIRHCGGNPTVKRGCNTYKIGLSMGVLKYKLKIPPERFYIHFVRSVFLCVLVSTGLHCGGTLHTNCRI